MEIAFSIEIMRGTRNAILKIVEGLDIETLNKIPSGFHNNLAWNIGHIVVTPQILCYKKAGVTPIISEVLIAKYAKGSKPETFISQEEFDSFKSLFFESVDKLEADYNGGKFHTYETVVTSLDVKLDSIEKAIEYCATHDNLHFGYMQALKRAVK